MVSHSLHPKMDSYVLKCIEMRGKALNALSIPNQQIAELIETIVVLNSGLIRLGMRQMRSTEVIYSGHQV